MLRPLLALRDGILGRVKLRVTLAPLVTSVPLLPRLTHPSHVLRDTTPMCLQVLCVEGVLQVMSVPTLPSHHSLVHLVISLELKDRQYAQWYE